MSMKFDNTKRTEDILKLTKFSVAMVIFGIYGPNNIVRSKKDRTSVSNNAV